MNYVQCFKSRKSKQFFLAYPQKVVESKNKDTLLGQMISKIECPYFSDSTTFWSRVGNLFFVYRRIKTPEFPSEIVLSKKITVYLAYVIFYTLGLW